jgi:hypothetical protein
MIVVKIEMWPQGDSSKAREIGFMRIANEGDHPDHPKRGNYKARIMRRGSRSAVQRESDVENYPRLSYSVWELVRRALNGAFEKGQKS